MRRVIMFLLFVFVLPAMADSECPIGYTLAKYTQLEYIESTGTQYIDTGLKGHMGYTYEFDFQQIDTNNYRLWGVFGQQNFGGYNMSLTWSTGWMLRWEASSNASRGIDRIAAIDTRKHNIRISNGNVIFDGVDKGVSTGHSSNYVFNYNLFLGSVNPAGAIPSSNAKAKFFSYKVWDNNGNLIQNYIPVLRNSGGAIGMYDTVSETFFRNAGTGTFIAGPEVLGGSVYTADGICSPCPPNTYKDFVGNGECTPCPDAMVSPSGSKSVTDCGRALWIGDKVLFMSLAPRTTTTLNVMDSDGNIFYGNLYSEK